MSFLERLKGFGFYSKPPMPAVRPGNVPKSPMPAVRPGNVAVWINDKWVEVCDFCGGNCGQCGTSIAMGVPPELSRMAKKLGKQK